MNSAQPPLPLVVQLGFAGSRCLLDTTVNPTVNESHFLSEIQARLVTRLNQLPADLGLTSQHFFCGVSQVAIGADTLFTRACQAVGIPQRVFLPQHRDEYLNAIGSNGQPDFPGAEKQAVVDLLASPHIIHERVVSDAADRHARFEDVNLEIVRISDVLLCLLRADVAGKSGGTRDLIDRAANWNKPVLVISVGVKDGRPDLQETWHWNLPPKRRSEPGQKWLMSALPPALAGVTLPAVSMPPEAADYFAALKRFTSDQAVKRRNLFKRAALVIIGTHILATVCAVVALTFAGAGVLPWLLGGELLLLVAGLGVHQYLHRSEASHVWAVSRLVAELTRSVLAIGRLHVYLDYLFTLPFPEFLRPVLSTVNVLHLRSTRAATGRPWEPVRDSYVERRLTAKNGQREFYRREAGTAKRHLKRARRAFLACSVTAIFATLAKLLVTCDSLPLPHDPAGSICGGMAIVFPVLAVAALSLAAAFDVEARHHTFSEMHAFLEVQILRLNEARSEREFAKLLLETESRLLGETVNWFSRRSFTGVA